jgi:tRNA(Ile2) C34 agmatinyltransferase TiaS
MSEIVEQQQHFAIEMERILALEPGDILCPNCRYNLEHAGKGTKDDSYILKCARCGFTLVKKSHFDI